MTWYDELDKWTADYLPDMPYEHDVPLSRYTSFHIGGPARRMAFPQNGEQLILLLAQARELSARPFVLGNGTNLLCPDGGVDRLVIHTRDLNRVERVEADPNCLRASPARPCPVWPPRPASWALPAWSSPTASPAAWAAACA